jgi:hypothetical protein
VAALFLAAVNGLNLLELIADHHAIGIMDALVLAPIGGPDRGRRPAPPAGLAAPGGRLVLGALNVAEQYAPLALGLTPRRLSLPGGELASWLASWAFAARLLDHVDLDTLSAELLAVVDRTMQPTATPLWLRPSAADPALASPPART